MEMRGAGVPGAGAGIGLVIVSLSDELSRAPQVPQNRCAGGFGARHEGQRVSGMRGRGRDYIRARCHWAVDTRAPMTGRFESWTASAEVASATHNVVSLPRAFRCREGWGGVGVFGRRAA